MTNNEIELFYNCFMKGSYSKEKLKDFYFIYNQSPSQFVKFLAEEKDKKEKKTFKESNLTKCPHCFRLFRCKNSYLTHLLTHSRKLINKNHAFFSAKKLTKKSQLILQKNKRQHKCSRCENVFYLQTTLRKHFLSHSQFKCNKCNVIFNNDYSLKLHKDYHLIDYNILPKKQKKPLRVKHNSKIEGQLKCNACKLIYLDKFSLIKHSVLKHTINLPLYECPIKCCRKIFKYKAKWLTHLLNHAESQKPNCQVCGLTFITFDLLKEHFKYSCYNKSCKCFNCKNELFHRDFIGNTALQFIFPFINKYNYNCIENNNECVDCKINKILPHLI